MYDRNAEMVTLSRDCEAVLIPAGNTITLPAGTLGQITQALGGSFTVYVNGNLVRIAGQDADALGREPVSLLELPPDASDEDVEKLVWDQMRTCFDPEIPINIVDLGLVYECRIELSELMPVRYTSK
jgi:Predicted metal-sulfur cluster biosynthetic enzyme